MTAAFVDGCLAGFAVAVPIGAVGTLILLTAASRGWRIGATAGLGAATADGAYASVVVLLGSILAPFIANVATPLRWLSAAVLAVLGVLMIRDGVRARHESEARPSVRLRTPGAAYLTVLGITLVNPTTIIYFAALVAGSPAGHITQPAQGTLFVVGAALASVVWQVFLASCGSVLGRVLDGPAARRCTALIGGGVVMLLALRSVLGR